ncbi:MAG: helix-turn-helix transcriptional regulator [Acidobacteriia bacterium]|nr:helix-turn-helix transcriptional regulator [Terriglobia bacterium]
MFLRTPADIGAFIRERRKKLGLDQDALARKAGTSRQWVVAVERGKPGAEIGLVLRTLTALGISLTVSEQAKPVGSRARHPRDELPPVDINQIISSLRKREP